MSDLKFYGTPRKWTPGFKYLAALPVEVTEDEFDYMLNQMPPIHWRTPDAFEQVVYLRIETFMCREFQIGQITAQYAKVNQLVNHSNGSTPNRRMVLGNARYFMKYVIAHDADTHLTRELIENGLRLGMIQKGTGFCNG